MTIFDNLLVKKNPTLFESVFLKIVYVNIFKNNFLMTNKNLLYKKLNKIKFNKSNFLFVF